MLNSSVISLLYALADDDFALNEKTSCLLKWASRRSVFLGTTALKTESPYVLRRISNEVLLLIVGSLIVKRKPAISRFGLNHSFTWVMVLLIWTIESSSK